MSVCPNTTTLEYYGLVDVHLIRRIYMHDSDYQNMLEKVPGDGGGEIQASVDQLIADLNTIVKTRVQALGGNCIIGYKVDIDCFECEERR